MKILVTGANGFIGKNLLVKLREKNIEVISFGRDQDIGVLPEVLREVDCVIHLAGVNRPKSPSEFNIDNYELTRNICQAIESSAKTIPILFTSSVQSGIETPYGLSKKNAERYLRNWCAVGERSVFVYRLPNVFGKWAKPNYNSVAATFCSNISQSLPIKINDPNHILSLVYIDDVVSALIHRSINLSAGFYFEEVGPIYRISVGDLAKKIMKYSSTPSSLIVEHVGHGLDRALYATYLSYLKPTKFAVDLKKQADDRGSFVEILKTIDSGQFSFFTAKPGKVRGGHYHHTKNEKFVVVQGRAMFKFKHILSGDEFDLLTDSEDLKLVQTVPGWSHSIENIGSNDLLVFLWANEIYEPGNPDTFGYGY